MEQKMVDVTLHIDENTTRDQREGLRDQLLELEGVMAVDYHDNQPHLMIIEYNPDHIDSHRLVETAEKRGYHVELVGM
ncbi:MAG: ATP-binding protein [Thiohalophilus sp.]